MRRSAGHFFFSASFFFASISFFAAVGEFRSNAFLGRSRRALARASRVRAAMTPIPSRAFPPVACGSSATSPVADKGRRGRAALAALPLVSLHQTTTDTEGTGLSRLELSNAYLIGTLASGLSVGDTGDNSAGSGRVAVAKGLK